MQQVIREAAKAIEVESATIGLFTDDHFTVRYVYNMAEDIVGVALPASELNGLQYAAEVRDVVAFNDTFNDKRLNFEKVRMFGIRSMMIAPFIVRGEVLGAMTFQYTSAPYTFTDLPHQIS